MRDFGRSAARVLIPPALLAIALWALWQLDATRSVLGSFAAPRAAAHVRRLEPVFDGPDAHRPRIAVALEPIVTGIDQPTDVAAVPGHPDRLVVLSKLGTAWLASPGRPPTRWFDVPVETRSELGLLGIAFPKDFPQTGTFVVNLNPRGARKTEVRRGHVDPVTLAAPALDEVLLEQEQPYDNHNGGQVAFGPDGRLYVAFGDGGSAGDPEGRAQDLGTWLGKILRVEVGATGPIGVPADNPFVGRAGARSEIWVVGLRNPWRFTFDPARRMVVADVGQDRFEEIDLAAAGDNLGWNVREADRCFRPEEGCADGFVDPIWSYGRDEGVSVTGGVVVMAPGALQGRYVFGDFVSGRLWAMQLPGDHSRVPSVSALGRFDLHPSAFGRAPDGSAWVVDYQAGAVFAVVPP